MGYLQNLRKLATGRDLDGNIVIENPKIQILKELLEDIPDNQKVIIWHNLYIELEDILKAIKDNFVLLNGEQNNKEKAEAIYNFKHGDNKYLIATQSTGGVGLNFTEATINIYFSNSFNLIDRLQSESRSHRIGQQEQLIIYDIINLGSIDTKILKSLERKEDFLQQLQDLYKQKKEEVIKNLEDK
jgi:SNF2 family DNA or RNA helicase